MMVLGLCMVIMLGLTGDGFSNAELKDQAELIRDDIVKMDDAAEVELKGILEEQIYVEFDNAKIGGVRTFFWNVAKFYCHNQYCFFGRTNRIGRRTDCI